MKYFIDYEENSFVTFLTEKFKVEEKILLVVLNAIALIRTDAMMVNISDLSYIALDFFVYMSELNESKLNPLFALFYRHKKRMVPSSISSEIPENIIIACDPDSSLDFEEATIQARQLFEKMCPGEEFLPAGPDPDEEELIV
ncbi:8262_t:CDS:1 [Scutellospora calospora]|uniref:8262_t:CDS:1 n=1 Tax=Scutellospora calospora TaxID=85575 RepID=A0ACA9LH05_9GLOM|nr:8262_t:CDS:1 [Scutellospora calospora]